MVGDIPDWRGFARFNPANSYDAYQAQMAAYQDAQTKAKSNALQLQQEQEAFRGQQEASSVLPQILMGMGGGQQAPTQVPSRPNLTVSGPPTMTPMGAPMGSPSPSGPGPQMSAIPPQAPQASPPPSGGAGPQLSPMQSSFQGYELPDLIRAIQQQAPGISGEGLKQVLSTLNPVMLSPAAKAQLAYFRAMNPTAMQNAETRRMGAETARANNLTRQMTNFGRQVVPIGGQMGPGGSQVPMDGIQSVGESDLAPPPDFSSMVAPSVLPVAQKATAVSQQKEFAKWDDARPQLEQTLVTTGNLLEGLENAPSINGAGSTFVTNAANWLSTITGDQSFADRAAKGQIQNKEIADLVIGRVGSLAGVGVRTFGTDMGKTFVAQSKPNAEMQPAAFANVLQAGIAPVVGEMMRQDYLKSIAGKNVIYKPEDMSYFQKVQAQFPFFKREAGRIQFVPENVSKAKEALAKRAGPDFTSADQYMMSVIPQGGQASPSGGQDFSHLWE